MAAVRRIVWSLLPLMSLQSAPRERVGPGALPFFEAPGAVIVERPGNFDVTHRVLKLP